MKDRTNFFKYALLTGLLAGTLDLCGAVLSYLVVRHQFPYKILEYIASGAFGSKAMNGSLGSNLWGLFVHYLIATAFSFFYFFIYPGIPLLHKNIPLSAILYGVFAWAVTNMVVLPLSALQTPVIPANGVAALRAAFILVICIGLPIAWLAKKFYSGIDKIR